MRKRACTLILVVVMIASSVGSDPVEAQTPTPPPASPELPLVVQIQYDSRTQLDELAGFLDIWEVHPDQHIIVARIWPEQYDRLASEGWRITVDQQRPRLPGTIPGYDCYRTINELYARLQQLAASYPDLVQMVAIGYSYESRPLRVVKITNRHTAGEKPRLFLLANIHARELITPETAMTFVEYLTDHYGSDADVTWLLDYHEIYVLVSANPDGHVKNEPGNVPWSYWRKNTHPEPNTPCYAMDYGVDLNRNFSFKWGEAYSGSSGNACADTYRGQNAASESETKAIQNFVASLFPDQRGPNDDDVAPDDTTGILISLHSYGNLVLWPWGWTPTQAPNAIGLRTLGTKLASYNRYTPQQARDLYATNGTTDDWSYGELGIASFTFEIGTDGFYPDCSRYNALIQPNIPALIYAAKVARTPYLTAQGPDALAVTVTLPITATLPVIQAVIDDTHTGIAPIAAAEYYLDLPPWAGGPAVSMEAMDGAYDAGLEDVQAGLAADQVKPGQHILYVRGQDSDGHWGPVSAVFVTFAADSHLQGKITEAFSGSSVPGAKLALESLQNMVHTQADNQGNYSTSVVSGTYTATINAFGYSPIVIGGIEVTGAMTATLDFSLVPLPRPVFLPLLQAGGL
jgi:carboxypeptidase T